MTFVQQTLNVAGMPGSTEAVHLLLTEGNVSLRADDPEQVIEEINVRANLVGSVLEDILLEPHREQWPFDE